MEPSFTEEDVRDLMAWFQARGLLPIEAVSMMGALICELMAQNSPDAMESARRFGTQLEKAMLKRQSN